MIVRNSHRCLRRSRRLHPALRYRASTTRAHAARLPVRGAGAALAGGTGHLRPRDRNPTPGCTVTRVTAQPGLDLAADTGERPTTATREEQLLGGELILCVSGLESGRMELELKLPEGR